METLELLLDKSNKENSINKAAEILKNGGIVAMPTETVYGLAASAYDNDAITKIFTAKGRPQDNPLIVHISNMQMLSEVAENIPPEVISLTEEFWPGPLTLVLKKGPKICNNVSAGLNTVAVRMPNNEIALELINKSGLPLAAPSANLSGRPSPTKAEHVIADLKGKIDAVLMSDDCAVGVESTVVSLCTNPPRLLRPGAVTKEQLEAFLPNLVVDNAVLNELKAGEKVASPGMKYKHYAPKTEVILVEGSGQDFANYVNGKTDCIAVCFLEDSGIVIEKTVYGSTKNEATLAKNLFECLRQLDNKGYQKAYVHAPTKSGIGLAVYNRLIRAAAFKVVKL